MSKDLDALHRQQLRQKIGKRYPHKSLNRNLYNRCKGRPISIDILKARWRILAYILCLSDATPTVKAIRFNFERTEKGFKGRPTETIATTLNKDINRAKSMKRDFPILTLNRMENFVHIRSIAQNRKA